MIVFQFVQVSQWHFLLFWLPWNRYRTWSGQSNTHAIFDVQSVFVILFWLRRHNKCTLNKVHDKIYIIEYNLGGGGFIRRIWTEFKQMCFWVSLKNSQWISPPSPFSNHLRAILGVHVSSRLRTTADLEYLEIEGFNINKAVILKRTQSE